MKRIYTYLCVVCVAFLCAGCQPKAARTDAAEVQQMEYAHGFAMADHGDYREIIIYNPWNGYDVMDRYYLLPSSDVVTPKDGKRFVVPVKKVGTAACTQIGFLEALQSLDCVAGVCNPELIYSPQMQARIATGGVANLGDAMQVSVEQAIRSQLDALFISGYGQGDANSDRMKQAGIPTVYINEWIEQHPLARAEWIKVVGAFIGNDQMADSLFTEIADNYNRTVEHVQTIIAEQPRRPKIMSGNNFRGTWYVPSGTVYMAYYFRDAGADYYFQNDSTVGSIPLSIEMVLKLFGDADVWVGSNGTSMQGLAAFDDKHTWFKAYRDKRVYNFYRRRGDDNRNDFWEMGVVRPDRVLTDLVWAVYPTAFDNYTPWFINHLE